MTTTPIRLVIGDTTLRAELFDNPAARSLLEARGWPGTLIVDIPAAGGIVVSGYAVRL